MPDEAQVIEYPSRVLAKQTFVGAKYTHFSPFPFPPFWPSILIIASSKSTVLPAPVGAVI